MKVYFKLKRDLVFVPTLDGRIVRRFNLQSVDSLMARLRDFFGDHLVEISNRDSRIFSIECKAGREVAELLEVNGLVEEATMLVPVFK